MATIIDRNLRQIDEFRAELSDSTRETEFLRGLTGAFREIYSCALSIVGNRLDAEDVAQEVCIVLWKKFDEFEPGTNFQRWARTVTFNVAKAYARRQRRRRGFGLDDDVLAKISGIQAAGSELFELRRERLPECLSRLPVKDQRFLGECYRSETSIADYARTERLSVATVYTKLKRLRKRLVDCINQSLGEGDSLDL